MAHTFNPTPLILTSHPTAMPTVFICTAETTWLDGK
eukprot:CAMPEP_0198110352 /NCGR_PEP_ID=MMETSP1442-20131203/2369_1 /TAXON_ID= /ORGANISM="Craspedostauros australis, Strain CCMP3328" /LENGTH=35 /DNA_ID= /DNA_START= /DNA_END= /DNA_ORIENTATION=